MIQPNKRALIVEDDPDFASLVESILGEEGFATITSFNGEDALQQVRYRPPDLVALDIELPRKSGLYFYRRMKSDPALRDIPVIVITGLTRDDKDMENIIRAFLEVEHLPPPDAYVEKPFQKKYLVRLLHQVCGD